jgi:hypothetical protein
MKGAITTNQYRKDSIPHPPAGWEPLTYVDATPDKDYVLRILRSHLENSKARWGGSPSEILDRMNEWQDERRKLIEAAIKKLS